MSTCIEKLSHPGCGSSDALQVYYNEEEETYTGYCFSCDTYVDDPYNGNIPSKVSIRGPEDDRETLEEIRVLYPTISLENRFLTKESLEYFDIKIGLSEQDGKTPTLHYYPYYKGDELVAYKVRVIANKNMWVIGSAKDCDMFGWAQALGSGAKTLYITEGELDAVALYQALKDRNKKTKWEEHNPAVVSISKGATGARKDIINHLAQIRASFKDVVLVFDQDDAGKAAEADVLQAYPVAKTVTIPGKDANDCLIKGFSKGLTNAVLFKSSSPKNTRLVWGSAMHDKGRQQATMGLSWPWEGLTKLTRGLRFGETYYLGAGVKMGKSELVNTLAAHLITEHGMKVFLAKPEEGNRKTYQMVVGKVAGRIFHDPDVEFDYDAYDKASKLVGDNLCMLDLYQHMGWDNLRADITVAHKEGCQAVFIDPITNLINGIDSAKANTILQAIAQELAAIAKDLQIMIFIFCHLKAPDGGAAHERGGKVYSHQFSGSRAMMRSCNMMLGLEGNKDPDLEEEERNMRKLVVLEDREFGATGYINIYWDKATSLFNEIKSI